MSYMPDRLSKKGYNEGDILVGGPSGVLEVLGVGADGEVLTSRSTAPNGIDWEAVSSAGGNVIFDGGDSTFGKEFGFTIDGGASA